MIIDTSALLAVTFDEPDSAGFAAALGAAPRLQISAATWLEAHIVVHQRKQPLVSARFDELLERLRPEVVPVSQDHASAAWRAYQRFGRGNHPARLNYGDCFAYALAKVTGEPLLFKGTDFSQTDITPALKA